MLNLIQNLRFDRNRERSSFSFKKNLENYNTSELLPAELGNEPSNKHLSSHWISIYRKQ